MISNLKPYREYQDSGLAWLGQVPSHWETRPAFGAFVPNHERNHGMKEKTVLSLSYGRIVIKPAEKLHGLVPESFETYQVVHPGDIVLRTTDLQNDHTSLRVGIVRDRGIITSAYLALRTRAGVSPQFGFQFLNVWDFSKAIYGYGSGLRQSLDFSHFKRMPVAVPPPDEQATIVRFLDWANGRLEQAIRAKRKAITLLNEQKQAIIHRAVTRGLDSSVPLKPSGISWLGSIPKHWELRKIKQCSLRFYSGGTPDSKNELYYTTDENAVPWLLIADVSKQRRVRHSKHRISETGRASRNLDVLPSGTVVLAMYASVGVAAVLEIPATINQALIGISVRADLLSADWLLACLDSVRPELLKESNASTQANLNAWKVRNIVIPVPPLAEQLAINTEVESKIGELQLVTVRLEREIELLREYRSRLVADVVTGKLDVREAAARLPDEVPLGTVEDVADLGEDLDIADEEATA